MGSSHSTEEKAEKGWKRLKRKQMTKLKDLNKQYAYLCNEYIKMFCTKQDIEFDGWIGDEVGGIASFISQYFFNLSDIVLDLNTKQRKGLILRWQDDGVDFNIGRKKPQYINYKSYTMGLRYQQLEKKK